MHGRGGDGATTRWNRGTGASVVKGRYTWNAHLVLLSQEQLRRRAGGGMLDGRRASALQRKDASVPAHAR